MLMIDYAIPLFFTVRSIADELPA